MLLLRFNQSHANRRQRYAKKKMFNLTHHKDCKNQLHIANAACLKFTLNNPSTNVLIRYPHCSDIPYLFSYHMPHHVQAMHPDKEKFEVDITDYVKKCVKANNWKTQSNLNIDKEIEIALKHKDYADVFIAARHKPKSY